MSTTIQVCLPANTTLKDATRAVTKQLITRELWNQRWHRNRTARALGITPKTLRQKIQEYGLATGGVCMPPVDLEL